MARVKGSNIHKNRRKKILKLAKGYFGSKHKLYKTAKEQVMHSLKYAYRDRKQNKREMRKLWITRINAACRMNEISYSKFISGLNKAGIEINRKMLSEVAIDDAKAFTNLVNIAKDALAGKTVKQAPKAEKTVAKKETTKKEVKEESTDLSKLTVAELKKLAKEDFGGPFCLVPLGHWLRKPKKSKFCIKKSIFFIFSKSRLHKFQDFFTIFCSLGALVSIFLDLKCDLVI